MLSASRGRDVGLDSRLKNITVRNQWGSKAIPNGIASLSDNEYLYAAGCRAVVYAVDDGKAGTKTVMPHFNEVTSILSMHVSACKTYLAASVRCSGAEIKAVGLIFALRGDPTARPKQISHELEGNRRRGVPGRLAFIGMAFSANTKLLVCHCNHVETGILIYDWSVQQLICTIEVKSMLTHVSFNPKNDTKLCVTGHNGTFQFWHYGPRSAHVAPIEGLPTRNADLEYFNHEWISPDCVVAGCSSGEISLVQGCGERQRVHAFDQPNDHNELVYAKPTYFLIRKEKLFCFSNQNFVSVFDINHQDVTGGRQWSLQLSQRCRLGVIDEIVGLSWTNTNDKDLSVAVFTSSGLYRYELSNLHILTYEEGDEDADDTSVESVERKPGLLLDDDSLGDVTAPSNLVSARSVKKGRGNRAASIMTSSALSKRRDTDRGFRWGYLRPEKVIMRSHQGAVAALSLSRRSSIMATASAVDKTLRTWDFNMTNQSDVMVEDFSDRATDVPNTVDLHPSGLHAFVGCEDYAIEYAVTESRFEITKKIPVKIALVTPSGEPFVNSSPVSLVRYSHGGQYIAIVTGRLVQIYHLYNLDYSTDKAGAPTRVMALSEHNAAVTDLAFSVDDRKIYTTSQDGALYEWTFGKATRDSDFIVKNVPALNVASSPLMSTVIAYFESPEVSTEKSKRNTLTKRGSVSSGIMQPPFQSSQSFSANVNKNRASMTTLGALDSTIVASAESLGTTTQRKMFLAYFESGVVSTTDGKILPVDVPVTSIAFGIADHSRQDTSKPGEIFVMGLADGRVLITMLPLPLRVLDDIGALQIIVRTTTTMSAGSGDNAILGSPIASRLPSSAGMDVDDLALTELTAELADQEVPMHGLDDSKCRAIALHEGAVMNVVVSPSGNWILSAGIDGCLFLLATTVRARTMENALESLGGDNTVFLTDRMALLSNKETLENMRQFVADAELEKNRSIGEMQTNMNNHSKELTAHLQSELERRDGIIVKGREEQTRICRIMQEEIDSNKAVHEKAIQELEVYYEKRLAQNQQYLQSMMQAYDEQLVHARKDLDDLRAETEQSQRRSEEERLGIVGETDKQKAVMLQYCDYISERNKEVFVELEETHDMEKLKLKNDLVLKAEQINLLKQKNRTDLAVINRQVMLQKEELSEKDMKLLTQRQEIETLLAKLNRQEKSLTEATAEILRRTEIAERWEYKAGVQQQQLLEIEKVRKALTTQLHSLREKMGPQWELLVRTEDRLKEVDTEYGQSLVDLSEKEAKLAHAGSIVQLMQKQLRELRARLTRKDHALNRAVKILTEFELRMEEAKFENGRKITVKKMESGATETYGVVSDAMSPGGNKDSTKGKESSKWQAGLRVMDVFSSTPEMQAALKRLRDILFTAAGVDAVSDAATPALDDVLSEEQQLVQEQQRQMTLLQKNIVGLKSNLKLSASVSSTKINHFLHDNDYLLEQVNSLRQQVRHLTNDNRMLAAREAFVEAKKISRSVSLEKDDEYSEASKDSKRVKQPKKHVPSKHRDNKQINDLEESLSTVGMNLSAEPVSLLSNSQFPAPPVFAAAPNQDDLMSDDGMVGSLGLSRDDIIAQTLSEQASVDRSLSVIIKGGTGDRQTAADRKIADILASNQKLIEELNLEHGRKSSVVEAFQGDVRSAPGTPDLNLSRSNTAESSSSRPGFRSRRVKSPEPPGVGKKISSQLNGGKNPLRFGGTKPKQGITTQGQIYAPVKTAVQLKKEMKGVSVMRNSASVNCLTLPPVSSTTIKSPKHYV